MICLTKKNNHTITVFSLILGSKYCQKKQKKVRKTMKVMCEDIIPIMKVYERLIKNQKQNNISLVYRQGSIFSKFKESGKYSKMLK